MDGHIMEIGAIKLPEINNEGINTKKKELNAIA